MTLAIFVSSTFFFGSVFSYSYNCLMKPILGQMIERRDLTKLRAFQNSKPFSFIRYAITQLVERDTPAKLLYIVKSIMFTNGLTLPLFQCLL